MNLEECLKKETPKNRNFDNKLYTYEKEAENIENPQKESFFTKS